MRELMTYPAASRMSLIAPSISVRSVTGTVCPAISWSCVDVVDDDRSRKVENDAPRLPRRAKGTDAEATGNRAVIVFDADSPFERRRNSGSYCRKTLGSDELPIAAGLIGLSGSN